MKKELEKLMQLAGTVAFDKKLDDLYEKYKDNEKALAEIRNFITTGVAASAARIDQISIKMQLAEITDIISLAYIAKHYFNKTKAWLSQRVNAHNINGKPAVFTADELNTLNLALKDISKKIGSVSVR